MAVAEERRDDAGEEHRGDAGEERAESRSRRPDRSGLFIAGGILAACAALVGYGILAGTGGDDDKPERRVPTAAVTYEVTGTGTADITYQARSESGKAVVVEAATLPWRKTVDVPLGREAVVSITLGEKGGEARCAVAVRGRHVQGATAAGEFGRATCSGALPRRSPTPDARAGRSAPNIYP
ncbi:hypothetical protein [Streptomyces sp. NPDC057877]|uniref:hypothetical protein n=1 Tax=Streptomyces sp. NPDC057877 TaxID=3346269 RepID=UPI003696B289